MVEEKKSSGCDCGLVSICSDLFRHRKTRSTSYSSTKKLLRRHVKPPAKVAAVSPTQFTPSPRSRNNPQQKPSKSSQLPERISLVRASSGNVMLYGNLGNLHGSKQSTPTTTNRGDSTLNVLDYLPKTAKESELIVERHWKPEASVTVPGLLDPEELKKMGDEEYKQGRYAEAVIFYDQAIALDPKKAMYRSNKADALTNLGLLLEAVAECSEAARIEPSFKRVHHRLGILYLRLGKPKKAAQHLKRSGTVATPEDTHRVERLQRQMRRSDEARRSKQWTVVVEATRESISSGADSSPQVFAMQAEALLRLQRHDDAETTLIDAPKFGTDESTKFFGTIINAFVISVHAQIAMTGGKFDEAVTMAQMASQINPSSKEATEIFRRCKTIAAARTKGNDLFHISKYTEASVVYTDGLYRDPYNSILLCNRAACRIKMNQLEMAVEDCNLALKLRPSYTKARLRRADCYSKMESWGKSIDDYEMLLLDREMAGNKNVQKALSIIKLKLKEPKESLNKS